jgi:starch phosphorylase
MTLQDLSAIEPDAGLGNGGLGRLAACFIDSLATMQIPAIGYGLRYEYGMFRQELREGAQVEEPDHWLRRPDPWEVARPDERARVHVNASVRVEGGVERLVRGQAACMLGIPYDRPVVGYGGRTINTLRLWGGSAPEAFDFDEFSSGDFVGAAPADRGGEPDARALPGRLDRARACCASLKLLPGRVLAVRHLARFRRLGEWSARPTRWHPAHDTHPSIAVAELMRLLLDQHLS